MQRIISTLNLEKDIWLRIRKQGIGGSDIGAICGFNPYKTAIQVYQDKISPEIIDIDNEAMRQGRELEEYVAKRFTEKSGKKVRRANYIFCNDDYPFMIADVDCMIVGENAGLECKTANTYMSDKWAGDAIPIHYQLQCHHYMAVTGCDAWYIAVLIFGKEFKYYKIERDEEIIASLRAIEKNFWEENVKKRIMPDPDGSKIADSIIAEYYKHSNNEAIPLNGFNEKLKRREELAGLIDKMDTEKKQIEQELKLYLGDAEVAENDLYRVSWKEVFSNKVDVNLLKEENPEIYKQYLKTTSSRRFTVKKAA